MVAVIPLRDASRRPTRLPWVTASIIVLNAFAFVLELAGGDTFVTRWAVIPAAIVSGHHLFTIATAMFMHGSWSHIIGNMVFLWAFGPEVEDLMAPRRYLSFLPAGRVGRNARASGSQSCIHRTHSWRQWRDCRCDGRIPDQLSSRQDSIAPRDLGVR